MDEAIKVLDKSLSNQMILVRPPRPPYSNYTIIRVKRCHLWYTWYTRELRGPVWEGGPKLLLVVFLPETFHAFPDSGVASVRKFFFLIFKRGVFLARTASCVT